MAFHLKSRSAVFEENRCKLKQLIWLKVETMNENREKTLEGFRGENLAAFECR